MKLKGITQDPEVAENGDWVDIPGYHPLRLKTLSIERPEYRNAKQQKERKLRQTHGGDIPVQVWDRMRGGLAAKFLLVDWQNVPDANGKTLEFDADTAHDALTTIPGNESFVDMVEYAARVVAERARGEWEDDLGNSEPASANG